jgi:DNA-binding LacI/PurR family transcriptional regulator
MPRKDPPARTSKRVTIKDVAAAAGVSPMTVSNVVNGKHQFVGERTRKTVEREIARLNYRVQHSAWSLRVARRRAVGMILVDESPAFLADHFSGQIVAGLTNILSRADHTVSIQGIRGDQLDNASIIRNFAVDGFCVTLSGTPDARRRMIDSLVRLDQPLVLIQEPIPPPAGDVCIVRQDDAGGGRLIADHLAARRVGRLLVVVPGLEWPAVDERVAGLRRGIAAAGGDVTIDIIETAGEDFDSTQTAVAAYLDNHPLPGAIVGANDRLAIAAMSLLESRGIAVPGKVRITGFNGFESRRYARPLITTVRSAAYEMGERAGELLLERLSTGAFPVREVVLPVHFDLGETT